MGLGNHLSRCKERQGRDYSIYLSAKTLAKRAGRVTSNTVCPHCHKQFRRLDTHLQRNATCKRIAVSSQSTMQGSVSSAISTSLATTEQEPEQEQSVGQLGTDPHTKRALSLPRTEKEWHEADMYFKNFLVPCVQQTIGVSEKNELLISGVYGYFASTFGMKSLKTSKRRVKSQSVAAKNLADITQQKNEARSKLRKAKREGSTSTTAIKELASSFFHLVRMHSIAKRQVRTCEKRCSERKQRKMCHHNFWKFSKQLLDDNCGSNTDPQFSKSDAESYFREIYSSGPRNFAHPEWLPSPSLPQHEFNCEDISLDEVRRVIKRSKSSSTPSPHDQISYNIFKRCPSLSLALLDIYTACWEGNTVPNAWKVAVIKLLPKPAADQEPTSPANFRPIALTSCVGKIFTRILQHRWQGFMLRNNYMDRNIQKAFLPSTPGCTEHHSKLAGVLSEARHHHKSIAVCWLDLANAYGSVHHSLIRFALNLYHAPPKFKNMVSVLYSGLAAQVSTPCWSTTTLPLQIGVYQGDPLSVSIFNTVINTLVDTLQTRRDLGYSLSNSRRKVSLLQYADDTCIVADSPASAQHLLNMVDSWLGWAGMKAKPSKCHSLALEGSSGKLMDPHLSISGQSIPYAGDKPVKFLGMEIQIPSNRQRAREIVSTRLNVMLQKTDSCPITAHQKLRIYRAAICPRLSWLLLIQEFPITWVKTSLEAVATAFLKKWSGLARPANTALLYMRSSSGGLNLPSLTALYKKLQASRQCQLLTCSDPCVRHLAERHLQNEARCIRKAFRPAIEVQETMKEDPGANRKTLTKRVKARVLEADNETRVATLLSQQRQGHMLRSSSSDFIEIWAKVVQALPPDEQRFSLNATVDTLPHNSNLYLWKKKPSSDCPLCGEAQTLVHVLNCCPVARDLRRYNHRHDAVLKVIVDAVQMHLSTPNTSITADLGDNYSFPTHIVPTDLRPDIVWWNDVEKTVVLVELTIPFDTLMDSAHERKQAKYDHLLTAAKQKGFHASLITLEIGARGMPHAPGVRALQEALKLPRSAFCKLLTNVVRAAIVGSFSVWVQRNKLN